MEEVVSFARGRIFFPLKATCVGFVSLATLLSVVVRLQTSNGWLMLLLLVLFKIFR